MTERKSLESERAELVALEDEYLGMAKAHRAMGEKKEASNCELIVTALRSLGAQDQEPVAWQILCLDGQWQDAPSKSAAEGCVKDGTATAIRLSPPPAAGWEEATRYLKKIADLVDDENACDPLDDAISYANRALEVLRHNEPPDSGAGKLETELPPLTCDFAQALPGGKLDDSTYSKIEDALDKIEAPVQDASGKWLSLHERIAVIAMPDHGGADAGVRWPDHCFDPTSCADHRQCMYIRCRYEGQDITSEVDAALSKSAPVAANSSAKSSIVTCCVTGAIPGDGGACGDCDPCIMGEPLVPEAVKRLIAEKNSLIERNAELEDAANASAEPALNWQLSDDAKARIAEIDDNLRNASLNARNIVAGSSNASAELQNDLAEMLRALGMSDAAQPKSPHEVFQSAIAEMKRQIANASAEARLREALEKIAGSHWERVGHCQTDVDDVPDLTAEDAMQEARKALSAHPHASDCDKQGEAK